MSKLTLKDLDKCLIKTIPELKDKYVRYMKFWTNIDPGQFLIFGDFFNPFLISLLESNKQSSLLTRIFNFIEKMANSNNEEVINLLKNIICRRLGENYEWLKKARKYMGEKTLLYSHEVEKHFKREMPNMVLKKKNYNKDIITHKNLEKILIVVVPELKNKYKNLIKSWKEFHPGLHIIFGKILNPFLLSLLHLNNNKDLLKRVFNFLEKMATSEDIDVVNVLQVTVCERLGDDKEILRKARKYMGGKTLFYSQEVEKFWGREN